MPLASATRRILASPLVDLLVGPHGIDRYLELVNPALTIHDARAEVLQVRSQTRRSVTLTLRPNRAWGGFRAGQFVRVGVEIDGIRRTRTYSPASSEHARNLELTVTAHPDGVVSNHLRAELEPGAIIHLGPATGEFVLTRPRPESLTLISGGSGITPVLSMLRTLDAEGHRGSVVLLHYAPAPETVPHRAELDAIAERHSNFRIALCYPGPGSSELLGGGRWSCPVSGRFGHDQLDRIAPWFATAQTYVCGPASLMDAVRTVYQAEQLEDRLHTEEFTFTAIAAGPDEIGGTTTFTGSGVSAENTGISLLEQAESAGLTPEYGCRMGICLSCTAIKRSGCTRDLRTGELAADPGQPIQLCVNAAVGDVDIDIRQGRTP